LGGVTWGGGGGGGEVVGGNFVVVGGVSNRHAPTQLTKGAWEGNATEGALGQKSGGFAKNAAIAQAKKKKKKRKNQRQTSTRLRDQSEWAVTNGRTAEKIRRRGHVFPRGGRGGYGDHC